MANAQDLSSAVDQKTGTEWTYTLYFDSSKGFGDGTIYRIEHKDLKQKFAELVDVEEDIVIVEAFRRPLFEWQVTQELGHHLYIVFKTRNWWWTIEKGVEAITVQRTNEKKWVRDYYRRESRTTGVEAGIEFVDKDQANSTIKKLIEFLYNQNELSKRYNLYTSNCKHFGEAVFNMLAKNKTLYHIGTEWTYELYFDQTSLLKDNRIYRIKAEVLKESLAEMVDVDENIVIVEAFRCPLFRSQVAQDLGRLHLYIVFKTQEWWWSIEKDVEGISIQRSKDKKWVRDFYKRKSRTGGLTLLSKVPLVSDTGDQTVEDLIDWIYNEDELNKPYDDDTSNSLHFGEAVFKTLAKDKHLHAGCYM